MLSVIDAAHAVRIELNHDSEETTMEKQQKAQKIELTELEHVAGGETNLCTYDGKTYSEGAVIKNSAGGTQTCGSGGKWN